MSPVKQPFLRWHDNRLMAVSFLPAMRRFRKKKLTFDARSR
jgi:hypothetical protein